MNLFLKHFNIKSELEPYDIIFENIEKGIPFKGTNLWILFFAIIVASVGLNVNSTAVIIGAMLISPLMGPIMGLGLSIGINDIDLLKRSFNNYVIAAAIGLVASTLYFLVTPLDEAHSELLARTSPTVYDVLIAFFGGLAGIIATSSKLKGNVIPGVAIATALMPPLCTAGYGLATMQWYFFFGALYLFFINTVFIGLATLLTVRFMKFPLRSWQDKRKEKRSNRYVTLIVILTLIPSIYFGYDVVKTTRYEEKVERFIEYEANFPNDYLLKKHINSDKKEVTLIYGGELISEAQIDSVRQQLKKYELHDTKLAIQQGFAYLNNNHMQDETNAALNDQMLKLQGIKSKYDSLMSLQATAGQIYKELKVQYPQVRSFVFQPVTVTADSVKQEIWLSIISHSGNISNQDRIRIGQWLKVRSGQDSIKYIYDRR